MYPFPANINITLDQKVGRDQPISGPSVLKVGGPVLPGPHGGCIVTMALSCIICEIKRYICRKSWFFSYHIAFDAPVRGVPVGILPSRLVWENENGGVEDMYSRLDSVPAYDRRKDKRTDRRTSCDGIVRAMHTHRAAYGLSSIFTARCVCIAR